MMNIVKQKTAVVTGGSEGIGLATAKAFAEKGCNVAICARNEKNLKKAGREIPDALAVKCDVRKEGDVKTFISRIKEKFGRIDYLINNAGAFLVKELEKTTEEEFDAVIDTNLKGIFLVTKHALPLMEKGSVIVNVSSGAGKYGFACLSAYCASKFGVIGLTESLADELKGVKVYAVCPGAVNTKMYHSAFPGANPKSLLQPEQIARKILRLCEGREKSGSAVDVYGMKDIIDYAKAKLTKKSVTESIRGL